VQPCVDFIRITLPQVDVDDVEFLSVKQAAEAKKQINALIRSGSELNLRNLTEILVCQNLAHLYLSMIEIKEDLMDSMIVTDSPVAYINGEKIVGEGFVLKNSSIIMKLVNREVFAFANFNTVKNWGYKGGTRKVSL
jgi:hypothetical protein